MSGLIIKRPDAQDLNVPQEIEAQGGEAIDKWVAEQTRPRRVRRPKGVDNGSD